MRLYNPLDKILNNETKIKLSRFFCRTSGEWSGRRIAREINISPAAAHKALSELQKEGILKVRVVGRSYLYSLVQTNLIVKNLLRPLYKKEEMLPLILANTVKKLPLSIKKRVISLAIFGSVSKKRERPSSDIDVFVVVRDKKDKELLDRALEQISLKILKDYGNILSPYILDAQEFKLKFKKGLPLLKNIIRDHKLILGKPITSILYERKED